MTDKQCIQMHQHSKNMVVQLNRQRLENTDYCDVIIKVEDVHFSAHRSVLAACSPFFDAMFTSKMVEQFKKEVEIKDVKKHIFNDVINFIYTDQIVLSADNVRDVLHYSSFLQIKDLLDATVEYLTQSICPENWFVIRGLGQLYTLPTLVLQAEKCMLQNFDESSLHESFLELTATDLDSIIKSEDLVVSSEFVLLLALISWVQKDVKNRQQHFLALLKYVRFQFIPIEYLTKTFRKMDLVKNSPEIRDLIEDAMCFRADPNTSIAEKKRAGFLPDGNIAFVPCIGLPSKLSLPDQTWKTIPSQSTGKQHCATAVHNGKLYCFGGIDVPLEPPLGLTVKSSSNLKCFDGKSWVHLIEHGMGLGSARSTAVIIKDTLYIFCGINEMKYLNSRNWIVMMSKNVLSYNLTTKFTTPKSPFNTLRTDASSVCITKKDAIILGGYIQQDEKPVQQIEATSIVERYDTDSNTWKKLRNLNIGRASCAAAVLNGKVFVFGGYMNINTTVDTCEFMNLSDGHWTLLTKKVPHPLGETSACCLENHIVVYGAQMHLFNREEGKLFLFTPEIQRWKEIHKKHQNALHEAASVFILQ